MPKNYKIIRNGLVIKQTKIPAACHEIRDLAEKVVKYHELSYDVSVDCKNKGGILTVHYCLEILILGINSIPFGQVEYSSEACAFITVPEEILFKWESSTITNIPDYNITLEDHIKRVLSFTFKPINRKKGEVANGK